MKSLIVEQKLLLLYLKPQKFMSLFNKIDMKKIVFGLIMMNLIYTYSQKQVGSFNFEIKSSSKSIQKSFSIFNKYNSNTSTFLFENKAIYAYLLNENFNLKKQLTFEIKKHKYNVFIGKTYDKKDNYTLILSNSKRTKFAIIKFLFDTNKVLLIEDSFDTKNLRFLQSVNKGDKAHLLFLDEKTSNIVSRNYSINKETTSTFFDFKNEKFFITDKKKTSLKQLLTDYTKPNHSEIKNIVYELTKINDSPYKNEFVYKSFSTTTKRSQVPPTSIELSSRLNKLYINESDIIITLDKNRFYTQILTLNLEHGTYTFQKIKKPLFNVSSMNKRSNSFIHNNLFFLITASKDVLNFSIYNLENKNLLKEFITTSSDSIKFKNSPIIQEGGAFKEYRSLEQTKQFLRKVSQSNIGIGVTNNKDGYEIVIGCEKQTVKGINTISTILSMGLAGFSPNLIDTSNFSQTDFNSFTNYLTTKSVRIHCLFDENFNHKAGRIQENIYDRITNFIKPKLITEKDGIYEVSSQNTEVPQAIDIFKTNNSTILGFYLPLTKKYSFYTF